MKIGKEDYCEWEERRIASPFIVNGFYYITSCTTAKHYKKFDICPHCERKVKIV